MKNKARDIKGYGYAKGESLLLDANIWLYVSAPPSSKVGHWTKQYSAALKRMISAGAALVTSSTVLSEYLNRYCRIEWEALHRIAYPKFKDFRKSTDFSPVASKAALEVNQILALCRPLNDRVETCNIGDVLTGFEAGVLDFNDGLITHFCTDHGCKLVTNDSDFTEGGIEILTANNVLLASCPA